VDAGPSMVVLQLRLWSMDVSNFSIDIMGGVNDMIGI